VYNLKFNKSIIFKKEEGTLLKDIIQSYDDLKDKSQSIYQGSSIPLKFR